MNKETLIVKDVVTYGFLKASNRKSYFMHPTFTYRGNHENFIVGLFGETTIRVNDKISNSKP